MWGIINDMGEYVVEPDSRFKEIGTISEKSFTYSNGTRWGLMGLDGKTMIRPKYKGLIHDQDNLLLAAIETDSTYEYEFTYIDNKIILSKKEIQMGFPLLTIRWHSFNRKY